MCFTDNSPLTHDRTQSLSSMMEIYSVNLMLWRKYCSAVIKILITYDCLIMNNCCGCGKCLCLWWHRHSLCHHLPQSPSAVIHRQSDNGGWGGIHQWTLSLHGQKSGLGGQATSSAESVCLSRKLLIIIKKLLTDIIKGLCHFSKLFQPIIQLFHLLFINFKLLFIVGFLLFIMAIRVFILLQFLHNLSNNNF